MMRVLWIGIMVLVCGGAHAGNYAQNFNECPEHFYQGTPPDTLFDKSKQSQYPLCFRGFAVLYSGQSLTALYSAEYLSKKDVIKARKLPRVDSFRSEPRLPKHLQVELSQYRGTGFDRGHLVPNGNMADVNEQYDSFSLANIIPQDRRHNQGVWREIESHTRHLASDYGEMFLVTGVVFMGQDIRQMNGVYVPTHLYKAVYIPSQNIGAAYLSANSSTQSYDVISLDDLKNTIGVDVFPRVEANFRPAIFMLNGKRPDVQDVGYDNLLKNSSEPTNQTTNQIDNGAMGFLLSFLKALLKALLSNA